MDSRKIKLIAVLTIAFVFAIYLGIASATAQVEAIVWVVGIVFLGICLMLGKDVWILIPATLCLRGGVNFLPGLIPPWVLMTMTTAGFFVVRVAVKGQNLKFRWTKMETAILLVGFTILQALVRNPVGLAVFGGESAGGKSYIIFAFAFLAYYLINASQPSIKLWRRAIFLYVIFALLDGAIQASSAVVPQIAQAVAHVYTNVNADAAMGNAGVFELSERRLGFLGQLGAILGLVACSFWRPLSAFNILKPWRAIAALGAILCTMLSGFRSETVLIGVRFILGSMIRKRGFDIAIIGVIGFLGVAALLVSGKASKLPFGVQRVLTMIPLEMDLDPVAVIEAEHSSADRFEVWQTAMESDRYIKNKLIGDGFQFSAVEINAMSDSRFEGSAFRNISFVERCLETGAYHGFHVETIRFTGVLGLIVATYAMFVFTYFAWKAIKINVGQQIWPYVIFVCMPFLVYPFWYWFVFGSYRTGFPEMIAMAGMVKVIYEIGRVNSLQAQAREIVVESDRQ